MAAYWIARAKINDPVEYKKYADRIPDILAKFDAKVLARGGEHKTLEGPEVFERFVVIEFPSMEVAEACFNSAEYQDNVVLQNNKENVAKMLEIAEKAWVPIKPTAKHPFVFKMGDVFASGVLAQTLQRVVINNEPPKAAAKWAHDKIAEIVKS